MRRKLRRLSQEVAEVHTEADVILAWIRAGNQGLPDAMRKAIKTGRVYRFEGGEWVQVSSDD